MLKILIVEDDPITRKLLKQILTRNGYDVTDSQNGEEAIKIYDEMPVKPDVIILDFRMPKKNGLDLMNEILERDPSSNIFMISGDPEINDYNIIKNGIRFKKKPVKVEEFLQEIQLITQF